MWFQNARAKYRRNTLKQEQQERSGNGAGSVHQLTQGDGGGATIGDHVSPATSPPRPQRPSQSGPSTSPASLSDLSSTPSTTSDAQPPIGAAVASGQTGLIMMDFDRRPAMVDSMSMFGSPGFLVDNC